MSIVHTRLQNILNYRSKCSFLLNEARLILSPDCVFLMTIGGNFNTISAQE